MKKKKALSKNNRGGVFTSDSTQLEKALRASKQFDRVREAALAVENDVKSG